MSARNKTSLKNKIYFITFTIFKWQKIFTHEKYYKLVFKWFDYQKLNYNNKIHAYVIMPNHLHLILFLSESSPELSKLIQNAKRFLAYEIVTNLKEDKRDDLLKLFSYNADKSKNAKHKIFETNYDAKLIENEELFKQKLNYIHNNPCVNKWNLSSSPEEYIYSSASNYILGKGIYDVDVVDVY
ncbi:MAG TPA: hypothetical protein DEP28_12400 [Bacteroidetes bacterium]|nr:hypothetical protein [Bacteroidota bacterium]HCN37596.1 hypothetical protein [Bacteroidota bacterium]